MSEKKMDPQQNPGPQEAGAENTGAQEATLGEDRRKVLQKILIGGGIAAGAMLPDKWTKPVVEALAAPRETSTTTPSPTTTPEIL